MNDSAMHETAYRTGTGSPTDRHAYRLEIAIARARARRIGAHTTDAGTALAHSSWEADNGSAKT